MTPSEIRRGEAQARLLGSTLEDRATVDALLEGIDDLYLKYIDCVYTDQLSPPARDALWAKHFNPMTAAERNGGGHLRFIDGFLERSGGPFLLGERCTIADLFLYFALEALVVRASETRRTILAGRVPEAVAA